MKRTRLRLLSGGRVHASSQTQDLYLPCKEPLLPSTISNVEKTEPQDGGVKSGQDEFYRQAADEFGAALARLASGYESDPDRRRDLLQEIHLALWRSFKTFDARCSLRTWTYRVAHNVATSHVVRQSKSRRNRAAFLTLEEAAAQAGHDNIEVSTGRQRALARLVALIQRLEPIDRQLILAYLDAESIGQITGFPQRTSGPEFTGSRIYWLGNFVQEAVMSIDDLPNDLKTRWEELDTNFIPISLDELRKQAEKLQKGLRRRSLIGSSATWVGIAGFSACFFIFPNM